MERLVTQTQMVNGLQMGMQEYLLVAHPDAAVNEKVLAEKEQFTRHHPQHIAVKTKPHITIANFLAKETMEETIIRYTQRICSQRPGFEVSLNNYSGIPPNTLYLRVQNPSPFRQLITELKVVSNYVTSCSCPPVRLMANPNLTIAKRVPENLFNQLLMEYSQKIFHETFMVNELVLLRRCHQYDTLKTVYVFRLQSSGYRPFEKHLI